MITLNHGDPANAIDIWRHRCWTRKKDTSLGVQGAYDHLEILLVTKAHDEVLWFMVINRDNKSCSRNYAGEVANLFTPTRAMRASDNSSSTVATSAK